MHHAASMRDKCVIRDHKTTSIERAGPRFCSVGVVAASGAIAFVWMFTTPTRSWAWCYTANRIPRPGLAVVQATRLPKC